MSLPGLGAAVSIVLALACAAAIVTPAVRRTRLSLAHPAVAWLTLHAVFFGTGGALLAAAGAIDARVGAYIAGAALAGALGVGGSDRLARHRGSGVVEPQGPVRSGSPDASPTRAVVVIALLALALAAIAPMLATGLPLLADDPTGARIELAGLAVQPLRVALPAAVVVTVIGALRDPSRRRTAFALATLAVAVVFAVLLASRYLAAELVASVALAWLLAGRRADPRAVVGIGLAALLVFATVQVVRAPERASGREVGFAMERTVARVTLVQPRTLDVLMEAIPGETDHFLGLTWLRRIAPLVGRDDVPNLGYWIYPTLFPDQDPGVRGYAAPGLIGEAWANFGVAGLGLFAALGVVLERLGALLVRRRTGTADIAAGAVVVVALARTHALGVNGTLVILALAAAWRVLASNPGDLLADVSSTVRWRT